MDGIGYAHAGSHRDTKSANIMINNDGRIKINDFGIAHIETSTLTKVGDLIGTPSYMSPEQFTGAEVGKSSDLYSIGVIAYELLTGRKPFTGTLPVVMQQVVNVAPAKPSFFNPNLSPEIDKVLGKAMAKNPADRYQTASEFSDAFKAAIHASLMLAEPQSAIAMPDTGKLLDAARGLKFDSISQSNACAETEMFGDSPIIRPGPEESAPAHRGRRRTHSQRAEIAVSAAIPRVYHHRWQQGAGLHHPLPDARHHQRPAHAHHGGSGIVATVARNFTAQRAHLADGLFRPGRHGGLDQRRRVYRFLNKPWFRRCKPWWAKRPPLRSSWPIPNLRL
jgi:hypothetical protein